MLLEDEERIEWYSTVVLEVAVLLAAVFLMVVLFLTGVAHMRTRTPYGGTPREVRDVMLSVAGLVGDETVYDIGAGDGRLLIDAKRRCPGIRAIGYENALGVWLIGKLRILFSGQDVTLLLRNALRDDLSAANAVFLYLGPEMMSALEAKFDRELRPGTKVISHSFHFPHRSPSEDRTLPWGRRLKHVLLYQW